MTGARPDVFGAVQLGYLVVETQRFPDWRRFGADALGLHVDELAPRDTTRDSASTTTRADCSSSAGPQRTSPRWAGRSTTTRPSTRPRPRGRRRPARDGGTRGGVRSARRRTALALPRTQGHGDRDLHDPNDVHGTAAHAPGRLRHRRAGHGPCRHHRRSDPRRSAATTPRLFDARLSDWVHENIAGTQLRIRFLRVNERHHSVAVAGVRGLGDRPDPHHASSTSTPRSPPSTACSRPTSGSSTTASGCSGASASTPTTASCPSTASHPRASSGSSAGTPSSSPPTWRRPGRPSTYDSISIWGHTPIGEGVLTRLNQFRYAARSLRYRKPTLPKVG
jgi:hypothetical protein